MFSCRFGLVYCRFGLVYIAGGLVRYSVGLGLLYYRFGKTTECLVWCRYRFGLVYCRFGLVLPKV